MEFTVDQIANGFLIVITVNDATMETYYPDAASTLAAVTALLTPASVANLGATSTDASAS